MAMVHIGVVVKIRDNHQIRNKAAHIAVGVECDGIKACTGDLGADLRGGDVLGRGAGRAPQPRRRRRADRLLRRVTGFSEAIEATWPNTVPRCGSSATATAKPSRPRYGRSTPPTVEAAAIELDIFEGSTGGKKYPATVRVWRDAWERFIPFLGRQLPVSGRPPVMLSTRWSGPDGSS
jgi:putative transposase